MHPIHGCPENFRESVSTPATTFPEMFNGLLYRLILRMCVQNLKFIALPDPEIIGVLQKIWAILYMPTLPFSKIFNGICSDVNNLKFFALHVP